MDIGNLFSHPIFKGYQVYEYLDVRSLYGKKINPLPVEEYYGLKNKLEDFGQIIIDPPKKSIIILVHND